MISKESAYKHFMQEKMRIGTSYQDVFNAGFDSAISLQDQDKKETFESWVISTSRRAGTHLGKDANGKYLDNRVDAKWSAWKAAVQAQTQRMESKWIGVDEAKATLKNGDSIFAYCEFYGVIKATYAFEEGYYNPHRIIKKNGDSCRINIFTHFMARKPEPFPLPPFQK